MIIKIFSLILVISASYILAVFFAPTQAQEIGDLMGAPDLSNQIRGLKERIDGVSDTLVEFQNNTGGILDDAERVIGQARSVVGTTRDLIDSKVDQTKQVVDSVNKLSEAASTVKLNIDTLTSLSGSSLSGSSLSGSMVESTGAISNTLQSETNNTGATLSASGIVR